MIEIALCDDTPMEADFLIEMLNGYQERKPDGELEATRFTDAENLLAALDGGRKFDLFLLDIILPGMDGIELARELVERVEKPRIVFLTNSKDFAVEAFSVRAMDYLVKPVAKSRLYEVMDSVAAQLDREADSVTIIYLPDMELPVKLSEIVAVEVIGHALRYQIAGGKTIQSKVMRISFKQATEDLVADGRFLHPHRSFLINADHVEKLVRYEFIMDNGAVIPVSRLRFSGISLAYTDYLGSL